jgi:predicted nucleic acid-binding protein
MKDHDTAVMAALELALDVAYHDGTLRDLAVADEAYALAGYYDPAATAITHATRGAIEDAIALSRKGRPRRLLRADARGMLAAFAILSEAGIVTHENASEANRLRWLARGGHDR